MGRRAAWEAGSKPPGSYHCRADAGRPGRERSLGAELDCEFCCPYLKPGNRPGLQRGRASGHRPLLRPGAPAGPGLGRLPATRSSIFRPLGDSERHTELSGHGGRRRSSLRHPLGDSQGPKGSGVQGRSWDITEGTVTGKRIGSQQHRLCSLVFRDVHFVGLL